MSSQTTPGLPNYLSVWFGQTISSIGSKMTTFAVALWIFDQTGEATALALAVAWGLIPRLIVTLFAGVIIDRFNRKHLMIACDAIAGLVTSGYIVLMLTGKLEIWHIYIGETLMGPFDTLQSLTYNAAVTTMIDKKHYVRASSMTMLTWYTSNIIAPAIASRIYADHGLGGVMMADMVTFFIAVLTTVLGRIPQPAATSARPRTVRAVVDDLTHGFQFIWRNQALRLLTLINMLFLFFHDMAQSINNPMILARTGNDHDALASWYGAAGAGGLVAALAVIAWGGPRKRVKVHLLASASAGVGKILVGLSQNLGGWIPAQIYTSLNFPVRQSTANATWRTTVPAGEQGRVFAADRLCVELAAAVGFLLGAPLADRVFEPAMQPGGVLVAALGPLIGVGSGAGMGLLFAITGVGMMSAGLIGLALPALRALDRPHEPETKVVPAAALGD